LVAGQLTNALAPIRAGEVVRLGIVAAQGDPVVSATAALAGAKAIDTLCLVAISSAVVGRLVAGSAVNWILVAAAVLLAALVLAAGYVIGFMPAPPGRLGVFEAGVAAALISGGVALPEAAAASILLHLCLIVELAILMLVSLALSRRAALVRSRSA